ncbi:MAG: protein BatD [Deltaproteobacteria bacterium]|nr:protein BatD [Deltaproteobacteria bacterium]
MLHRAGMLAGFAALPALISTAPALAQSVRAAVDRTEVALDEHIVLSVSVEGAQSARPGLPDLSAAFDVSQRGSSQQVQIINGRMTSSVIYTYLLMPKLAGTFTVGPVSVEVGGRRFSSQPFDVRVRATSEPQPDSGDLFMTTTVSNREPYVGEQVVYTLRVLRRVRISDARLDAPDFAGFSVQELGQQRDYTTVVRGREYAVTEIRRALFAQKAGVLEIPGAVLQCEVPVSRGSVEDEFGASPFDSFFQRTRTQRKVVRAKPLKLEVRALPAAPAGFSGLVGQFDIKAELSKSALRTGDSTTLSVTISGTGNAQSIPDPRLPELPGFKVYDDKPSGSIDTTGDAVRGKKTFRKALVPLDPGEHALPALSLVYFDPSEHTYETAHTAPLALVVSPGEGREELRLTELLAPSGGKVAVQVLGDDILPNHTGMDALRNQRVSGLELAVWGVGFVAPPALFLGLVVARRRSARALETAERRRRRRALRKARAELRSLARVSSRGESHDGAAQVLRVVRGYIGDKLGMDSGALTGRDAGELLGRAGGCAESAARIVELFARGDAAHYGGVAAEQPKSLCASAEDALVRLEREMRA